MSATWSLQDAKNKFSTVVEDARRDGPQTVTRRSVSTRRATVPCARASCNSSRRLAERDVDFELMTFCPGKPNNISQVLG